MNDFSLIDKIKLFFRGWIDSPKSNHVYYRCPQHGVVECKVSGYGQSFCCPECKKEEN